MSESCITDGAYVDAAQAQANAIRTQATLEGAFMLALAAAQRYASEKISDLQEEVADRQMKLAEAVHEHAKEFWPYEHILLTDTMNIPKAEPQREALAYGWHDVAARALTRARWDWTIGMEQELCDPPRACDLARWDRKAAQTLADISTFAMRQAEGRAETLNDRRYEWQYAVLGMGRNILNNVTSFQNLAARSGGSAAEALFSTVNSGLMALGYASTRSAPVPWESGPTHRAPMAIAQAAPAAETYSAVGMPVASRPKPQGQTLAPLPSSVPAMGSQEWVEWNRERGIK